MTERIEKTYIENYRSIKRFIERRISSAEDSEDLLQDIFMKAIDDANSLYAVENLVLSTIPALLMSTGKTTSAAIFLPAVMWLKRMKRMCSMSRANPCRTRKQAEFRISSNSGLCFSGSPGLAAGPALQQGAWEPAQLLYARERSASLKDPG